ncbi:MAG: hypothetical protein PUP91_14440 [Rhizonema sp. PD37]|nr:hypothetical protein [Rhizonema sp. PD37]
MHYRVSTLISLALAIFAFEPKILAEQVKPSATSMLRTQILISQNYQRILKLQADSGPDRRGLWRFYKPNNVSEDAMRAQGCEYVSSDGAQWRCPRSTIGVVVGDGRSPYYGNGRYDQRSPDYDNGRYDQRSPDYNNGRYDQRSPDYNNGRYDRRSPEYGQARRRLRAESGPDNNGRWRFYKPSDVSDDSMHAQGCSHVSTSPPDWRCPNPTIRVEVNGR